MSMRKKSQRRRKCRVCKEWFHADPRASNHQKVCGKPSCQKARKQQSQRRWVKKNPEYFNDRYENTRQWLKKRPGYLKAYRKTHPEYVERNRAKQRQRRSRGPSARKEPVDIQDTIMTQPLVGVEDRLTLVDVDIQDTIRGQVIVPVYVSDSLGHVDIQDDISRRPLSGYTSARVITRMRLQQFMKSPCYA